jgi:hypothetical protein
MKKFLLASIAVLANADHFSALDHYITERDKPIEVKNDNIFTLFIDRD